MLWKYCAGHSGECVVECASTVPGLRVSSLRPLIGHTGLIMSLGLGSCDTHRGQGQCVSQRHWVWHSSHSAREIGAGSWPASQVTHADGSAPWCSGSPPGRPRRDEGSPPRRRTRTTACSEHATRRHSVPTAPAPQGSSCIHCFPAFARARVACRGAAGGQNGEGRGARVLRRRRERLRRRLGSTAQRALRGLRGSQDRGIL